MSERIHFHPVLQDGEMTDVEAEVGGRRIRMLGPGGPERERAIVRNAGVQGGGKKMLPVLVGAGLGHALEALAPLLRADPDLSLAVVDRERALLELTGVREKFSDFAGRIVWIDAPSPEQATAALTRWQIAHGGLPMLAYTNPFYLRLDRDYYQAVSQSIQASASFDFWSRARYRKFSSDGDAPRPPRILLITNRYFLTGEIEDACRALDYPLQKLTLEKDELAQEAFVKNLLNAVIEFRPDFLLTLNHLGVDREGVLTDLLARLELPLASWFVDNPHLILHQYKRVISPWTAIFTWDADNVDSLRALGFEHVSYLPLATTPERFSAVTARSWEHDISFVGNSMTYKVAARMRAAAAPKELLRKYRQLAAGFGQSDERSVTAYLAAAHPDRYSLYKDLPTPERRLAYETMLTWEATRQYRLECVEKIIPFKPLIVGDPGWKIALKKAPPVWTWHPELSYYTELPHFYPRCAINFNCTSKQMKGAVNQRIFDVPATGAFVLTDWREQMENLFEPGREIIFYRDPGEIPDLVSHYLAAPREREKISRAARKRILRDHTYTRRLQTLTAAMRAIFS